MSETKKYCLENQHEEYELSEKYLGWTPEGFSNWEVFHNEYSLCDWKTRPEHITLVSPDGGKRIVFNLYQYLMKAAFPLSFFAEDRAKNWWNFLLLSEKKSPNAKFILPMY